MNAAALILIAVILIALVACYPLKHATHDAAAEKLTEPPIQYRTDLNFGYYGGSPGQLLETIDHVTYYHAVNWDGSEEMKKQMQEATSLGIPLWLEIDNPTTAAAELKQLGVFENVKYVYAWDEPDLKGITEQQIFEKTGWIRREFPHAVLPVIYSNAFNTVGMQYFDLVGFDHYDMKEGIFNSGEYSEVKRKLGSNQKLILVPGGADPWRQEPTAFMNVAQNDSAVWGIVAFIYRDTEHQGIKNNGMLSAYRSIGLRIKNLQTKINPQ